MSAPGLPVLSYRISAGQFTMRPIRRRDARAWREVRRRNAAWLAPWEATIPPESTEAVPTFNQMASRMRAEARGLRSLPLVMLLDGVLVGQVTVGGMTWGSMRSAHIGYWVDQKVAGQGLTPLGVALASDYCFSALALHRLEIVIRPENLASLRVPIKLGFSSEGLRLGYLHIDGAWRDHQVFALNREQAVPSLLRRWQDRYEHAGHDTNHPVGK
ncbi:MAG: GNAT family N-acetyltransferase [Candidatus Nanopelagicales bacterium]